MKRIFLMCTLLLVIAGIPAAVFATTYSSSSFKVLDPVIDSVGGRKTSSSYILLDALGQNAIGLSNSSSFTVKSGFPYFSAPSSDSGGSSSEEPASTPSQSSVPIHILPLIRPLIPIPEPLTPEEAEELIEEHLPCQNGARAEDLNCDNVVGLIDFSIFLYLSGEDQKNRRPNFADFNQDGAVDIRDLSRLFFAWSERLVSLDSDSERGSSVASIAAENNTPNPIASAPALRSQEVVTQNNSASDDQTAAVARVVSLPRTSWSGIGALLVSIITLRFVFTRFGLL